ncbi:AgmX/PglI C-terminal domain-containing protein [Desulfonema magnum]|uniref:von Willebrand factor A-like domain-containing protein n=1 Tax=Desulfonema magnum TaxID=45655 RepID=A0A975GSL8_9BACT|nr:AgmX/PglI C-terminal domain-containing protein [Desulfonema magnum]QTA92201.1 von Willebrand factor A-like domain-containing protein [Desulfonema magnum]
MNGFPLDISKQLLKNLIGNLRPSDKFNVLLFAGASQFLSEQSLPATPENINKAIQVIDYQRGGGGTELLPALKRALAFKGTQAYSRSFVIVTDGYVTVEKEAFDVIRNSLGSANMFAFGIGSSVNRYIIEGMARVGMGEPFVITKPEEGPGKAEKFRKYIQFPVLTRAKADFGNFEVYDVEPPGIPDVLAERPVIIFGKWQGQPKGKIRLTGISGNQEYVKTVDVSQIRPLDVNAALPYLWARHRIALLSDYNNIRRDDGNTKEITRLGLKYNLLTEYTSFVAIDTVVRRKDGKVTTVKQPLPLPEGVSDYAVGQPVMRSAVRRLSKSIRPPAVPGGRGIAMPLIESEMAVPPPEPKEEREKVVSTDETLMKPRIKGLVRDVSDQIKVSENLSEQEVQRLLQRHLKEIEHCFRQTLQKESGRGEAVLKIVIDAAGQVTDIKFISAALKNEDLNTCVIKQVREWKFPVPADGKVASVEYSLIFE